MQASRLCLVFSICLRKQHPDKYNRNFSFQLKLPIAVSFTCIQIEIKIKPFTHTPCVYFEYYFIETITDSMSLELKYPFFKTGNQSSLVCTPSVSLA